MEWQKQTSASIRRNQLAIHYIILKFKGGNRNSHFPPTFTLKNIFMSISQVHNIRVLIDGSSSSIKSQHKTFYCINQVYYWSIYVTTIGVMTFMTFWNNFVCSNKQKSSIINIHPLYCSWLNVSTSCSLLFVFKWPATSNQTCQTSSFPITYEIPKNSIYLYFHFTTNTIYDRWQKPWKSFFRWHLFRLPSKANHLPCPVYHFDLQTYCII